jgi:hypothetical protein
MTVFCEHFEASTERPYAYSHSAIILFLSSPPNLLILVIPENWQSNSTQAQTLAKQLLDLSTDFSKIKIV